jgi:hypothetical protein
MNSRKLSIEVELYHDKSRLLKHRSLEFLANIRAAIQKVMLRVQENTVLTGDVVVDETLWTHSELEGAASNWNVFESQVWVFGLIEKAK